MSNVLFDRESLKVVGVNRSPLPFEVEIQNVDASNLTKQYRFVSKVQKFDEAGNPLFLLPQFNYEEVTTNKRIQSYVITSEPVTHTEYVKSPLLDDKGNQKTQVILDENGKTVGEIPLFYYKEVQVQDKDSKGNPLYWRYADVTETVVTELPPLEITKSDVNYKDGLEPVLVDKIDYKQVSLLENPELFTYQDIVAEKQKQIADQTFFGNCLLFEEMDDTIFSTNLASFNSDLGFGFATIPAGGELRTIKIDLPYSASALQIAVESSKALAVSVGGTVATLTSIDSNGQIFLSAPVDSIYVLFDNTSDVKVDLNSFAILV